MRVAGSFRSHYRHKLNGIGRVSIPSKFRDVMGAKYGDDTLVLVRHKKCLLAYPVREWEKKEIEFMDNPPSNEKAMGEMRRLLASAEDVQIDRNGRILIPNSMRKEMGLKDECVFLGMVSRFEIWSADNWESEIGRTIDGESELSSNMNEFML